MASFPDVPDALASPFVQAVLRTHPNTHAVHPELPLPASALSILRAYLVSDPSHVLPPPLAASIAAVRHHQLPRTPLRLHAPPLPTAHAQGMSPKKAHEVARMTAYVVALVRASSFPEESLHIVDVGAGQGYLTRALKARLPQAHVLALDADEAQTAGAQKWEKRVLQGIEPPIAHRTVLIGEGTLLRAVDDWIDEEGRTKGRTEVNAARAPVPVLFVALHACGSLTPDVLRAFTAAHKRASPASAWYPAAAVAVGCCYNLMNPSDFPLSTSYRTHLTLPVLPPAAFHLAAQIPSTWVTDPVFSSDASPLGTSQSLNLHPSAALAIRKVVWRALLERALQSAVPAPASPPTTSDAPSPSPSDHLPTNKVKNKSATVPAHWPRRPEQWTPSDDALQDHTPNPTPTPDPTGIEAANAHLAPSSGIGMTPALRRLGRLRDAAYADSWSAFLSLAAQRMGVVFPEEGREDVVEASDSAAGDDNDDEDQAILGALPRALHPQARALAALHVLRCIIGVLVESAVLKDRMAWISEELGLERGPDGSMKVALVNLFDQATGSGRNVAIVLAPVLPPPAEG